LCERFDHIVSEYTQHVNRYAKTVGSLSEIIVPDNVVIHSTEADITFGTPTTV